MRTYVGKPSPRTARNVKLLLCHLPVAHEDRGVHAPQQLPPLSAVLAPHPLGLRRGIPLALAAGRHGRRQLRCGLLRAPLKNKTQREPPPEGARRKIPRKLALCQIRGKAGQLSGCHRIVQRFLRVPRGNKSQHGEGMRQAGSVVVFSLSTITVYASPLQGNENSMSVKNGRPMPSKPRT